MIKKPKLPHSDKLFDLTPKELVQLYHDVIEYRGTLLDAEWDCRQDLVQIRKVLDAQTNNLQSGNKMLQYLRDLGAEAALRHHEQKMGEIREHILTLDARIDSLKLDGTLTDELKSAVGIE